MEVDIVCNFKRCRKTLATLAWVTSCSHIFCDEDGTREFSKSHVCPACGSSLMGKFDIVRINRQPSEQYKSMLLAGHSPKTIVEVCSQAMAFWTYQAFEERTYQEHVANSVKKRNMQLEQYYEQILWRTQNELNTTKKELETTRKKYNEVTERLKDKTRQFQKLQLFHGGLHRRSQTAIDIEKRLTPLSRPHSCTIPVTSMDVLKRPTSSIEDDMDSAMPNNEFIFRPAHTPILGFNDMVAIRDHLLSPEIPISLRP